MRSYAPWSVSKANLAYECPLRFHLKYSRKTRGRKPDAGAGRVGSGCHTLLEHLLLGYDFNKAFMAGAMNNGLTRNEILELKTYKDPAERFLRRFKAFRDKFDVPDDAVHVERQTVVDVDLNPVDGWFSPAWFGGYTDVMLRVTRNDRPWLIIIDHKSGTPKDLGNHIKQLRSYAVLGLQHEPDVAGVQACLHWPLAEDDDMFQWGPPWTSEEIRGVLIPELRAFVAGAEEAVSRVPVVARENQFCKYCEYQHMCPLKGGGA